jgi:uncharacterized protein
MLRAVYDTNVIVSGVLKPESVLSSLVALAMDGRVRLCLSPPILAEYTEVLRRPKFRLEQAAVTRFLAELSRAALLVHPAELLAIAPDEADNRFLECAQESDADYLVTGNLRHFPHPAFGRTHILTPAAFALALTERWPNA